MEYGGFMKDAFPILATVVTYWYVPVSTMLMTSQPLLTAVTSNDGYYTYSVLSVTLLAELLKLWFSMGMYLCINKADMSHSSLRVRDVVEFGIPALVYFVNNNLVFFIIQKITSTQYQVLSSLKTVFTAILFRVIMKKMVSLQKWASIASLACGAASTLITKQCEFSGVGGSPTEASSGDENVYNSTSIAASATLASCVLSSFSGVYNELLLKKDGKLHSIHLQNSLLYAWGVLFNVIGMFVLDGDKVMNNGLFYGYDGWVVVLLLNNAAAGLSISVILKKCNNLVRVFAHTAAMVITALIDALVMRVGTSTQLLLSIVIVTSSSVTYALDGQLKEPHSSRVFLGRGRSGVELEDVR